MDMITVTITKSPKCVTLPIPLDGEIYIHFGNTASTKVVSEMVLHSKVVISSSGLSAKTSNNYDQWYNPFSAKCIDKMESGLSGASNE
jgi:hypothetical protein